MNASHRVLTPCLQVLLLAGCGARGQVPTAVLDCGDLAVEVPDSIPPFDDRRSPVLLNGDSVSALARSLYRIPWQRLATLKVLVQADGTVSHACVTEASLDSAFDRVALRASELARFRPAGGATPAPAWTTLLVAAQPRRVPPEDERYIPIALPGAVDLRFESEEVVAVQAAVLNYFLTRRHYLVTQNDSLDPGRPTRRICIGVGPILPVFDPPEPLMARLAPTTLPLQPVSACVADTRHPLGWPTPRLVLKGDGDHALALALWVDITKPSGGSAQVRAGYYENGLNAADYECHVKEENHQWTVDECIMTAIA